MLVILPFWTSFLLRVYAWIGLLKNNGLINNVLMCARRDRRADRDAVHRLRDLCRHRLLLPAVHDPAAVREPREAWICTLLEAAADLGCTPVAGLPARSRCRCRCPGIIAGSMLVFIPAVGEFVIPALLGGPTR